MAKGINKVILLGNIGQDLDVVYTPSGVLIVTMSLATTRREKKDGEWVDKTEWHTVKMFGKLGEIAKDYLHKGSRVYIEGEIRTNKWEKDGVNHYRTEIIGNDLVMLDAASKDGNSKSAAAKDGGQNKKPSENAEKFKKYTQGEEDDREDDLPF